MKGTKATIYKLKYYTNNGACIVDSFDTYEAAERAANDKNLRKHLIECDKVELVKVESERFETVTILHSKKFNSFKKYKTIEEFSDEFIYKITLFCDSAFSGNEIWKIVLDPIAYPNKDLVIFKGGSIDECKQKVLDWANKEYLEKGPHDQ
jgi:hypothetical protein